MKIASHDLDREPLVIAEIGGNHGGDLEQARALLRLAAEAGAGAVKFQAYYVRDLRFVSPSADPGRFERMQKNELTPAQFRVLAADAASAGVLFLCSCFDDETVDALDAVLPAYKIASGDLTNDDLLRKVAGKRKPILLSTGMSTDDEIAHALDVVGDTSRVVLLQCTSGYPCPPEQVHLRALRHLGERFGLPVGYSDHTTGMDASHAALALGARVVEKHFTDRREGRAGDHQISAEPQDIRELVRVARAIQPMLGTAAKILQPAEEPIRAIARRSMGVRRDTPAGVPLEREMLIPLRPASGWPVADADALVGRRVARDLVAGDLVMVADLMPEEPR